MSRQTVGIVTDTVACLPAEHVDRLGIRVVPVHLLVDGDDYLDGRIGERELHRRIAAGGKVSTAAPSPGEFLDAYRDAAKDGRDSVLTLTVSSPLSSVYNSAKLAARSAPVAVEVVDTRTVASAQGLVVRRLAEMATTGATIDDLMRAFPSVRAATGLVAVVPDLANLARMGRIPRVVGAVGDRLDLKPLIEIRDDGEAHAAGVTRSRERALNRMEARAVRATAGKPARLVVMHTLAEETAGILAEKLQKRSPSADVEVAPFTTVMGIHTGPGLLGIAWEAGHRTLRPDPTGRTP